MGNGLRDAVLQVPRLKQVIGPNLLMGYRTNIRPSVQQHIDQRGNGNTLARGTTSLSEDNMSLASLVPALTMFVY